MRVGELAAATGVPAKTIRFYESLGVLPTPARRANGYRDYGNDDLCRVRLVATLRGLGLDLHESGSLAALCVSGQGDVLVDRLRSGVRARRDKIVLARAELEHLDAALAHLEACLGTGDPTATVCIGDCGEPAQGACSCGPGCPCGSGAAGSVRESDEKGGAARV
jgi:DNA-binding transcriptional MerR regulator